MKAIKPGIKPKKDNGKDDKRRGGAPATKAKRPDLKPYIHKPKDYLLFVRLVANVSYILNLNL